MTYQDGILDDDCVPFRPSDVVTADIEDDASYIGFDDESSVRPPADLKRSAEDKKKEPC